MYHALKRALTTNIALKIVSIVLGYALWNIVSQQQTIVISREALLYFYNIPQSYHVNAPETVTISLEGKKKYLKLLSSEQLAIHINGQELHIGEQPLIMNEKKLFLPEIIKLVNYSPTVISIDTQESVS